MKSYLKFNDQFKEIVLSGQKEVTTRMNFVYYERFMYENHMFEIDSVEKTTVREACQTYYRDEMFDSPDDMFDALKTIYIDVTNDTECRVVKFHKIY